MKKFFTLFSFSLLSGLFFSTTTKAQTTTWDFTASNPSWPAAGMGTDPVEIIDSKGLGLHGIASNGNFAAWNTTSATSWSAPNDVYTAATIRVQVNGAGFASTGAEATPTQRYFFIEVNQACTVKVWFKSGSGNAIRSVIASDGTTEYGKAASVGNVTVPAGYPTDGGFLSASVTKAGTFFLYGDAAVNIYQIQVVGATVSLTPTNPLITTPVKFSSINALNTNGVNKVSWTNEVETNTQNYIIERSTDGINYITVGTLTATGAGKYNWMDNASINGNVYYRVKALDKTGAGNYSSIVKIGANLIAQELIIAPNPVRGGQLTLKMNNFSKGDYIVNIYNTVSQKVFTTVINNEGGISIKNLQLSSVQKGIYNLQLIGQSTKLTKTLIVE